MHHRVNRLGCVPSSNVRIQRLAECQDIGQTTSGREHTLKIVIDIDDGKEQAIIEDLQQAIVLIEAANGNSKLEPSYIANGLRQFTVKTQEAIRMSGKR